MTAVPTSLMGWRPIFSEEFFSGSTSAINDALMEYIRTSGSFTASFISTGLQLDLPAAPAVGGYADRLEMRPRRWHAWANGDVEALARFTSIAGAGVEQFFEIGVGGDNPAAARATNYHFIETHYNGNQLRLWRCSAGSFTLLATASVTWTAEQWWIRFLRLSTTLYARVWKATGPEPRIWDITFTDTTPYQPQTGAFTFGLNGGNSGIVQYLQLIQEQHWFAAPHVPNLIRAM